MSLVRVKARALIGAAIIADSVGVLREPAPHVAIAEPLVTRVNTATGLSVKAADAVKGQAIAGTVGGALIATSMAPRLGALGALTASVPSCLFAYRFWKVSDPAERAASRSAFFAHLALVGAALLVLAGPTKVARHRGKKACCNGQKGQKGTAHTKGGKDA